MKAVAISLESTPTLVVQESMKITGVISNLDYLLTQILKK